MITNVLIKWANAWVEYLVFVPIIVLIGVYFSTRPLLWTVSLPIVLLIGLVFRVKVGTQRRWVYVGISTATALSYSLFFSEGIVSYLLLYMVGFAVFYRGTIYGERELEGLTPYSLLWKAGFPIYFIGHFFYRLLEPLSDYLNIITWLGVLLVVVTLFISNSLSLRESTLSKTRKPFVASSIMGKNRFYLFIMVGSIVVITNFKIVQTFISQLFALIGRGLEWLTSFFGTEEEGELTNPSGDMGPLPSFEAGEPAQFWLLLEKIVFAVMAVGAVGVGVLVLYYGGKQIGRWVRKSYYWLQGFLTKVLNIRIKEDEDYQYIDENESLLDFRGWRDQKANQAKDRVRQIVKRKPNWDSLSGSEKVSYVFREFVFENLKRGYSFTRSDTPNEIVQMVQKKEEDDYSTLAIMYEKMKYGEQEIIDEEASNLVTVLEKLEKKK